MATLLYVELKHDDQLRREELENRLNNAVRANAADAAADPKHWAVGELTARELHSVKAIGNYGDGTRLEMSQL